MKRHASDEVFDKFEQEYNMTMYLLKKALTNAENRGLMPIDEEHKIALEKITSKLLSLNELYRY